jgi:hypothetical protein
VPNPQSRADYLVPDYGGAGGSNYTVLRLPAYSRSCCAAAAARVRGTHRRSGFFYRPFLSRFYGIQFYGFRVRALQDSWFAVHARIACMTDGQSARFAWNIACAYMRSTRLLGSPAAIPCTSPPRIRWFVRGAEIIYLIKNFDKIWKPSRVCTVFLSGRKSRTLKPLVVDE